MSPLHALILALSLSTVMAAHATPLSGEDITRLPVAEVIARVPQSHPSAAYTLAARLWRDGQRDDAVKWFYVGQLRLRFHIAANPGLPRDGDPALMASLNATVGQTINEWAGGAPRQWAASIDEALRWDAGHDNLTTSKEQHAAVWQGQRTGMQRLRDQILAQQDSIREQRLRRGLEMRE